MKEKQPITLATLLGGAIIEQYQGVAGRKYPRSAGHRVARREGRETALSHFVEPEAVMNARLFNHLSSVAATNTWYAMQSLRMDIDAAIDAGRKPQRWQQAQLKRLCLSLHDAQRRAVK